MLLCALATCLQVILSCKVTLTQLSSAEERDCASWCFIKAPIEGPCSGIYNHTNQSLTLHWVYVGTTGSCSIAVNRTSCAAECSDTQHCTVVQDFHGDLVLSAQKQLQLVGKLGPSSCYHMQNHSSCRADSPDCNWCCEEERSGKHYDCSCWAFPTGSGCS